MYCVQLCLYLYSVDYLVIYFKSFCLNELVIYFYGISFNVDGRASFLKDIQTDEITNATVGKKNWWDFEQAKQDSILNPVLQNHSYLFEFLNVAQTKRENAMHDILDRIGKDTGIALGSVKTHSVPGEKSGTKKGQEYHGLLNMRCVTVKHEFFSHFGIDFAASFTLQIRTHCDLVKTVILVTENGEEKWLTGWPIACVCAQRVVDIDSFIGHPGRSSDQVDVDITRQEPLEPVLQQRVVLQGARHRSLSRAQRRRLRNQHRNMQNIESWEQIMERKYNNT